MAGEHPAWVWQRATAAPYPRNPHELRLWRSYLGAGWDWFPIHMWQWDIQRMAMLPHLPYWERFCVWLFFVGNGMDPSAAADAILARGTYDAEARRRFAGLVARPGHYLSRYRYWDMEAREYR